jgi:hypothetical protein
VAASFPAQPDEDEDREAERNMQSHGDAGLHPAMKVRHQPADQVLHDEEYDDQPVKDLCGGAVLQSCGHESSKS